MAFQAGFYCLPRRLAQWHPCCVDFAAEVDHGFETFARHPVGPREHSFDLVQLGSVPRQFQHSPTALNWSVLAVRQGVVEQLAGLAEGSDQLHQARQQLGPHAAALRAGVHFEVPPVNRAVFLAPQALPPRRERIDEEVAGLRGTAAGHREVGRGFSENPTRDIVCRAAKVMVTGFGVTPRFSVARERAQLDGGVTVQAQPFAAWSILARLVFFCDWQQWQRSRGSFSVAWLGGPCASESPSGLTPRPWGWGRAAALRSCPAPVAPLLLP